MSGNRGAWIRRRGQSGAESAIDQVIDRQPQLGEQVQQIPDELIEDSPYQTRRPFSDESIEDLAQGMRETGFQGALIARPHSEPTKRRHGVFQLVYGHRRRVAWRRVCVERGEPCLLPIIVREVSDERMLTIGAQENLQRQDLDPLEEAQLVAWHERMYFDKNQTEIGAMLGKSSDWVSVRSRVHKLPDTLKERLRKRPRAIKQMLELGVLSLQQPNLAVELADRVVEENLTVEAIHAAIREHKQPDSREQPSREETHNRRAGATSVQDVTNSAPSDVDGEVRADEPKVQRPTRDDQEFVPLASSTKPQIPDRDAHNSAPSIATSSGSATDLLLLQEAAGALVSVAARAETLPMSEITEQALDQAEHALAAIRQVLTRRCQPS